MTAPTIAAPATQADERFIVDRSDIDEHLPARFVDTDQLRVAVSRHLAAARDDGDVSIPQIYRYVPGTPAELHPLHLDQVASAYDADDWATLTWTLVDDIGTTWATGRITIDGRS